MTSDLRLEATVDKILTKTKDELLSSLGESYEESTKTLANSQQLLEQEYDKIIDEGRKEAEKIHKQIVGSSDLESRNKQLLLVEEAIDDVFRRALDIISKDRGQEYTKLLKSLIGEATKIIGTTSVTIYANSRDAYIVRPLLSDFAGADLSTDTIDCLGGVKIKSKDGAMAFDNTIDARFDRLKPLIRKEIATKFGLGN